MWPQKEISHVSSQDLTLLWCHTDNLMHGHDWSNQAIVFVFAWSGHFRRQFFLLADNKKNVLKLHLSKLLPFFFHEHSFFCVSGSPLPGATRPLFYHTFPRRGGLWLWFHIVFTFF